jgi:hypothetical protein
VRAAALLNAQGHATSVRPVSAGPELGAGGHRMPAGPGYHLPPAANSHKLNTALTFDNLVAGRANVLIFPDLASSNIAVKLVQYLAGAETYGQLLLGLARPCADLSRGATEDDILGVAAIVGLEAVESRKLVHH